MTPERRAIAAVKKAVPNTTAVQRFTIAGYYAIKGYSKKDQLLPVIRVAARTPSGPDLTYMVALFPSGNAWVQKVEFPSEEFIQNRYQALSGIEALALFVNL